MVWTIVSDSSEFTVGNRPSPLAPASPEKEHTHSESALFPHPTQTGNQIPQGYTSSPANGIPTRLDIDAQLHHCVWTNLIHDGRAIYQLPVKIETNRPITADQHVQIPVFVPPDNAAA